MSLLNIQGLADASGEVFPTVPAGTYRARVIKVEDAVTGAKSKNPGNPMLKIQVKLVDEKAQGQVLFMNIVLPNGSMDTEAQHMSVNRIKRVILACGLQCDDNFDTADLMGQEFKAVVALEEKDQIKSNNIKDQLPL